MVDVWDRQAKLCDQFSPGQTLKLNTFGATQFRQPDKQRFLVIAAGIPAPASQYCREIDKPCFLKLRRLNTKTKRIDYYAPHLLEVA